MAQGPGRYNPNTLVPPTQVPVERDTVFVTPAAAPGDTTASQGCGYRVLRFVADHAGVWHMRTFLSLFLHLMYI